MLPPIALKELWHAIRRSDRQVPYNTDLAICREWTTRPYDFGSPLGPEHLMEDGGTIQMFARGWISWHPDRGVESGP